MDKGEAGGGRWRIVHERGAAGSMHAASAALLNDETVARTARFCLAESPALVLGSHQPEDLFDRRALSDHGVELTRRRSGGSAVLVGPVGVLWLDLVIPRGDPLWDDDVGRASWWVGDLWSSVIARSEVWKGPMRSTEWSAIVCFAGLGPGEVTVDGRKVVGVCQRRTPRAALFQTAGLMEWAPDAYTSLLAAPTPDPVTLGGAAAGLGEDAHPRLHSALVDRLGDMIS